MTVTHDENGRSLRDPARVDGHGHVVPRADGMKARCGGPAICSECSGEYLKLHGKPFLVADWSAPNNDGAPLPVKMLDRIAKALDGSNFRLTVREDGVIIAASGEGKRLAKIALEAMRVPSKDMRLSEDETQAWMIGVARALGEFVL